MLALPGKSIQCDMGRFACISLLSSIALDKVIASCVPKKYTKTTKINYRPQAQ